MKLSIAKGDTWNEWVATIFANFRTSGMPELNEIETGWLFERFDTLSTTLARSNKAEKTLKISVNVHEIEDTDSEFDDNCVIKDGDSQINCERNVCFAYFH